MRNDRAIKKTVKAIKQLADEFLAMPNQCAYTDSIVDKIVKNANELKELHDTNSAS